MNHWFPCFCSKKYSCQLCFSSHTQSTRFQPEFDVDSISPKFENGSTDDTFSVMRTWPWSKVEISSKNFSCFIDEISTQFWRRFCIGKKNSAGIRPEFDIDFESMIREAFLILPVRRRYMVKISSDNSSLDVNFQLGEKLDLNSTTIRPRFWVENWSIDDAFSRMRFGRRFLVLMTLISL